ncbi:MAG: bifunctional serine/threonine-protein kinase/formylglycine-generating enzyme family protein, partial [Gemmatimonadetes bacterium]|nr:bifunctional serine/threonine-protein kinase/formylglycine-generating enzyme family protein [Gemmatimonadota bacterium]
MDISESNALQVALRDRYAFEGVVGEGGMGTVYRARDRKHGRQVAIKTIRRELASDDVRKRFEREIAITAHLQHPNIVPLLDSGARGEDLFYVMPFIEGESLAERLTRCGPMDPDEAIAIGAVACEAVHYAHGQGVIHRDLKPANILLTSGSAQVTDFGIGKVLGVLPDSAITTTGGAVGSLSYMAPEQLRGVAVPQSDVYSLGVVLYESVTGRGWLRETQRPDPDWRGVPPRLRTVLERALSTDPDQRWPSARAFGEALSASIRPPRPSRKWVAVVATLLLAVGGVVGWGLYRADRARWASEIARPRIQELLALGRHAEALALAERAEPQLADDSVFGTLWPRIARRATIDTDPPGAFVAIAPVARPTASEARIDVAEAWRELGPGPVEIERLAIGSYRLRAWAAGRDTVESILWNRDRGGDESPSWRIRLPPAGATPAGMVRVPPRRLAARLVTHPDIIDPTPGAGLDPSYYLSRTEVTNRAYKAFVDAGAYADPAHWTSAFAGLEPERQRALLATFVDRSGRPGPATWTGGTYPEGKGDHPVGGVSWYEAVAYARFVGARLPTLFHWQGAAQSAGFDMAGFGNYRGDGSLPVGSTPFGPWGVRDLAGNVREWVWNQMGDARYILGGAWTDPYYMYHQGAVAPPEDRSPTNGIRLADYADATAADLAPFQAPIDAASSAVAWGSDPVPDEVFRALRAQYDYDPTDLAVAEDSIHDDSPYWRREFVSFDAAYEGERVPGQLFLPKNAKPPYQTLLFFPGAASMRVTSSARLDSEDLIDALVKSGRAVLHPIYKDTY